MNTKFAKYKKINNVLNTRVRVMTKEINVKGVNGDSDICFLFFSER